MDLAACIYRTRGPSERPGHFHSAAYNLIVWVLIALCVFGITGITAQTTCRIHGQWGSAAATNTDWFCSSVPYTLGAAGVCEPCWKCCLMPQLYNSTAGRNILGEVVSGDCAERCGCNAGRVCTSDMGSCAQGLFCMNRQDSQSVCAPCTKCTTDDVVLYPGTCKSSCSSGGSLQALLGDQNLEEVATPVGNMVMYLSFALEPWRDPDDAVVDPSQVAPSALSRFIAYEILLQKNLNTSAGLSYMSSYMVELLASVYDTNPGNISNMLEVNVAPWGLVNAKSPYINVTLSLSKNITMRAIAEAVLKGSRTLLCPKIDTRLPAEALPRVTAPGCACNTTIGAITFRCPAGHRCSRQAYLGLSTDLLIDPTWAQLQGQCVPCTSGQYCQDGVIEHPGMSAMALDCPKGFYCPTPEEKYLCPAGHFCEGRSSQAVPCEYLVLLSGKYFVDGMAYGNFSQLVKRLRDDQEPLSGNYCPEGSAVPKQGCAAGHYCPNTSVQLLCPAGYYCKSRSVQPTKCPRLISCPEGAQAPNGRTAAGILVVCIMLLAVVIELVQLGLFIIRKRIRRQQEDDANASFPPSQRDEADVISVSTSHNCSRRAPASYKPMWQMSAAEREEKLNGFMAIVADKAVSKDDLDKEIKVDMKQTETSQAMQVTIRFTNLEYEGRLHRVTGEFKAAHLNVIMGPSGCGKSTLLGVLSGRLPAKCQAYDIEQHDDAAEVLTDDETVAHRPQIDLKSKFYRRMLGFVPQDDILFRNLTVRENLTYSARLRWLRNISEWELKSKVEKTLTALNMTDKADVLTGDIECKHLSGGQRKRVSIGMVLTGEYPVIFMDEPTSGLDAKAAFELCRLMGGLAHGRKINIIAVIHQPRRSSFLEFDTVMLLDGGCMYQEAEKHGGGRLVWQGPPVYCERYFGWLFPKRFKTLDTKPDTVLDIVSSIERDWEIPDFLPLLWVQRDQYYRKVDWARMELKNLWVRKAKVVGRLFKLGRITEKPMASVARARRAKNRTCKTAFSSVDHWHDAVGKDEAEDFQQMFSKQWSSNMSDGHDYLEGSHTDDKHRWGPGAAQVNSNPLFTPGNSIAALASQPSYWQQSASTKTSGSRPNKLHHHEQKRSDRTSDKGPEILPTEAPSSEVKAAQQDMAPEQSKTLPACEGKVASLAQVETSDLAKKAIDSTPAEIQPPPSSSIRSYDEIKNAEPRIILIRKSPRKDTQRPQDKQQGPSAGSSCVRICIPSCIMEPSPALSATSSGRITTLDGLEMPETSTSSQFIDWALGWLTQFVYLCERNLRMASRVFWPNGILDVLYLLLAGLIVGTVQGSTWSMGVVPFNYVMTFLVLSMLSSITHLRTFSMSKTVERFESMAGVSASATFLASNVTDLSWIFLSPAVYLAIYVMITCPRVHLSYLYVLGFQVCWWSSGLAYAISLSGIPAQHHTVVMVAVILLLGAFFHGMSPSIRSARGTLLEAVLGLSFSRWTMEAATIQEYKPYWSTRANEIIMIFNNLGLCGLDKYALDDGDNKLSEQEITTFLQLTSTLGPNSCDSNAREAILVIFSMGVGLRLIAWIQSKYLGSGVFTRKVDRISRSLQALPMMRGLCEHLRSLRHPHRRLASSPSYQSGRTLT